MCWLAIWSQPGMQCAQTASRTRTLCPARAATSAGGAPEASHSDSAALPRAPVPPILPITSVVGQRGQAAHGLKETGCSRVDHRRG